MILWSVSERDIFVHSILPGWKISSRAKSKLPSFRKILVTKILLPYSIEKSFMDRILLDSLSTSVIFKANFHSWNDNFFKNKLFYSCDVLISFVSLCCIFVLLLDMFLLLISMTHYNCLYFQVSQKELFVWKHKTCATKMVAVRPDKRHEWVGIYFFHFYREKILKYFSIENIFFQCLERKNIQINKDRLSCKLFKFSIILKKSKKEKDPHLLRLP